MKFVASLILIFLGVFTGTAIAADVAASPDATELLRQILDAVATGRWWAAGSAAVIGLIAVARHYMPESWKTGYKGDVVGIASAFALAFAGAIAAWAAVPGVTMSFAVAATATKVAIVAAGGFNILHKLIGALVAWGKLPAWATSILKVVAALIGSSAVKKAEAAGSAAVAAAPAPGLDPAAMKEID